MSWADEIRTYREQKARYKCCHCKLPCLIREKSSWPAMAESACCGSAYYRIDEDGEVPCDACDTTGLDGDSGDGFWNQDKCPKCLGKGYLIDLEAA